MREIKFRVWDKVNKKYYRECDFLSFRPGGIRFMWTDYEEDEQMVTDLPNGSFELLQFTGLHDKNGVEIYEGDILDVKFMYQYVERISWHGPPDARAKVIWDYSGFRLLCKGAEDRRYADWYDIGYFNPMVEMHTPESIVIGNIHESELLEV